MTSDEELSRRHNKQYFKGLLSERMVVKRVKERETITWETRSPGLRNEPLDARVYATGALELFNPNFEAHKKRRNKNVKALPLPKLKEPELPVRQEEQKTPEIKKPVTKHKVTGGFVRRGFRV